MKNISRFIFAALAVTAAASCAKEALTENVQAPVEGMVPYTATVSIDGTRAALDGQAVVWADGEKVAVYDGVNAEPNEFTVSGVSGSRATISGSISEEAVCLLCVYPFSAAAGKTETDSLIVKVPSLQVIGEGQVIAPDALVSVAKAGVGEDLSFKNVVSLVKFSVPVEGVKRVMFAGMDEIGVAGKMYVEPTAPAVTTTGTASMSVSNEAGFTKDADYYATVFSRDVAGFRFVISTPDWKADVQSPKTASFELNKGLAFQFTTEQIDSCKFPVKIYNKADLDAFAAHSALYYPGEWVTLCADIDYDGEWMSVADFEGNFDGGNHSVYGSTSGLKFKANPAYPQYIGFFSKVYAEVKDLKLGYNPETGEADGFSDLRYHEAIRYAGPLAGSAAHRGELDPVKISNVQNYVEHHADFTTATGTDLRAGNIIGTFSCPNSEMTSCTNYAVLGNISALNNSVTNQYLGGLIGMVDEADGTTITDCVNYGNIKNNTKTDYVVAGLYFSGGIVGRTSGGTTALKFVRCISAGNIIDASKNTKKQCFLGGILGGDNTSAGTGDYDIIMEGCINKCEQLKLGPQTGRSAAGGMIAYAKSNIHLVDCVNGVENADTLGTMPAGGNTATSKSAGYGGMTGILEGKGLIEKCTNYAPIIMTSGKTVSTTSPDGYGRGGIVGLALGAAASIENCKNYGPIELAYSGTKLDFSASGAGIGGIIGGNLSTSTVSACENYGAITETGTAKNAGAGGLVGYQSAVTTTGEGCKVNCAVTAANAGGMIAGNNAGATAWGSESSPIMVAGSFNGTPLTSENYTTCLTGGTGSATVNASFWAL